MKKFCLVVSILLLSFFSIAAFCTDYYVDSVNGSNDSAGTTINQSWRTITHAMTQIEPTKEEPVTIHVAAGLYNTDLGEKFPIEPKSNVTLIGAGMDSTILDAAGNKTSVMKIVYVENVDVSGFTLTGGSGNIYSPKYEDSPNGGGIFLSLSSAIVRSCKITENSAYSGGGILAGSPQSVISDCIISKNHAHTGGGVSLNTGTLANCIIEGNEADQDETGLEGKGGGIYIFFSNFETKLNYCTITNNIGIIGGGVYCESTTLSIYNTTIEHNSSREYGGGIGLINDRYSTISNCNIKNNKSVLGAGIYSYNSFSSILNSSIESNISTRNENKSGLGGGIYSSYRSSLYLKGCQINENIADNGGGILNDSADFTIEECQIARNIAENGGGIYCNLSDIVIKKCIIEKNLADQGGGFFCSRAARPHIMDTVFEGNQAVNDSKNGTGGGVLFL
jgi:hypothetical protein